MGGDVIAKIPLVRMFLWWSVVKMTTEVYQSQNNLSPPSIHISSFSITQSYFPFTQSYILYLFYLEYFTGIIVFQWYYSISLWSIVLHQFNYLLAYYLCRFLLIFQYSNIPSLYTIYTGNGHYHFAQPLALFINGVFLFIKIVA